MSLDAHYRHILAELGKQPGMLGVIFRKAQNKIQDPAKLKRLVSDLIDHEQWMTLDADVKGDAYEGLLAKNAEDMKSGAGQYFTPRPLIQAIVDVMRPTASNAGVRPGRRHRRLPARRLRPHEVGQPRPGREEVPARRRSAGLGDRGRHRPAVRDEPAPARHRHTGGQQPDHGRRRPPVSPSDHFDMVLTNPPFGKKSSYKVINAHGETETRGHELPA